MPYSPPLHDQIQLLTPMKFNGALAIVACLVALAGLALTWDRTVGGSPPLGSSPGAETRHESQSRQTPAPPATSHREEVPALRANQGILAGDQEGPSGQIEGYPAPNRWDEGIPYLPSRSNLDLEAERFRIDLQALSKPELESVLMLCDVWNEQMVVERNTINRRRAEIGKANIQSCINSARLDTQEAAQLIEASTSPDLDTFKMMAGRGIAEDGRGGEFIVLVGRGEDASISEAEERLWILYEAALIDLDSLLVKLNAKLPG